MKTSVLYRLALHRPDLLQVLASALAAVLLLVVLWWAVGLVLTMAHEGGHALAALVLGATVLSLLVRHDRTGRTTLVRVGPLAAVGFLAAGYVGPSGFGLAAAALLVYGQPTAVLWLTVALLALALAVSGTWFTRFAVVLAGAFFVLMLSKRSADVDAWTACTWTWVLLVGGLVQSVAHFGTGDDHHALQKATWLPVPFWSLLFTGGALGALLLASAWLTGLSDPSSLPSLPHLTGS